MIALKRFFHRLLHPATRAALAGSADATINFRRIAVHPCVINNRPYIIYPKGLKQQSPDIFNQLSRYFEDQGYQVKEDQRTDKTHHEHKNERRKLVPVLLFTASLFIETTAYAEVSTDSHHATHAQHQVELRLLPNRNIQNQVTEIIPQNIPREKTMLSSKTASRIFDILMNKYEARDTDPEYIAEDFKQIANYYSEFPETIRLLKSVQNKNWQLQYDEHEWVTTARGNIFEVHDAVIHFNTRSAAQLRLNNGCKNNPVCIASPADALLHELLHTQSMLVNTEEFIAQGGMNNLMYPYKHEYAVIDEERKLYFNMSRQDTIKRPYRVDHTGRPIKTSCPTCIK